MGFSVGKGSHKLEQRAIHTANPARSILPLIIDSQANGLFEAITGKPAPGSPVLQMRPHDHTLSGGGVVLPRGCVMSMDVGTQDQYTRDIQAGEINQAVSLAAGSQFHFPAEITEGVDSQKTSVLGLPCVLEAALNVRITSLSNGVTGQYRLRNLKTNTTSSWGSIYYDPPGGSNGAGWIDLTDVPASGGGWEWFEVELRMDAAGTMKLFCMDIVETRRSQPDSTGNRFDSLPRP